MAAVHALDDAPLVYDVFVSDPVEGVRHARLYRNGEDVLGWSDANYRVIAPAELAGMKLNEMRAWIRFWFGASRSDRWSRTDVKGSWPNAIGE